MFDAFAPVRAVSLTARRAADIMRIRADRRKTHRHENR
jgi:hypothetical protein